MRKKLKIIFCSITLTLSPFLGCDCEQEQIIYPFVQTDFPDAIKLYSSNGGETWEADTLRDYVDALYSIASTGEENFLISGSNFNSKQIYAAKTTNFGSNWLFLKVADAEYVSKSIVYSNNLSSAVLIIKDEMPIHSGDAQQFTVNNGANWTQVSNIGGLNGVDFYDASNGVVVGNLGAIYKTTNGGVNWVSVTSPTSTELRGISFFGMDGLAVGMLGRVIKTTDGGNSWVQMSSPTQNTYNDVVYISSNVAVAVGSTGAIMRTTNGGQSWQPIESPSNEYLNDVAWSSYHAMLMACGSGGTILRSTNYGVTWSRQTSGTTRTLYGIYFEADCYIVGD